MKQYIFLIAIYVRQICSSLAEPYILTHIYLIKWLIRFTNNRNFKYLLLMGTIQEDRAFKIACRV